MRLLALLALWPLGAWAQTGGIVLGADPAVPVAPEDVADRIRRELPGISVATEDAGGSRASGSVTLRMSRDGRILVLYRDPAGRETLRIVADTTDARATAAAIAMIVANLHQDQLDAALAALPPPAEPTPRPAAARVPAPRRAIARSEPAARHVVQMPERTVLRTALGLGVVNRSFEVEVTGSDMPRTYESPAYPQILLSTDLYPIALAGAEGTIAGLFLSLLYRQDLLLETSGPTDLGETIVVESSQRELLFCAGLEAPVGSGPRPVRLAGRIGYGYLSFELDPEAMSLLREHVQIPSMIYENLVLAASADVPLWSTGLSLGIAASYRLVQDVGQAARDLFGADTEGGSGLSGQLSLEGPLFARGLEWSLGFEYVVYTTEFSGPTSAGGGLVDGFPSGTDRFISVLLAASYTL